MSTNSIFFQSVFHYGLLMEAFLETQMIKTPPAMQQSRVQSLGGEDPLEEGMATPVQYSGLENPHGQRSLVGHSP